MRKSNQISTNITIINSIINGSHIKAAAIQPVMIGAPQK